VGHFDCFHKLATTNNAPVNICVQVPFLQPDLHSFRNISRRGVAGSYDSSIFSFLEEPPHYFP
jgi:hypothetical protein